MHDGLFWSTHAQKWKYIFIWVLILCYAWCICALWCWLSSYNSKTVKLFMYASKPFVLRQYAHTYTNKKIHIFTHFCNHAGHRGWEYGRCCFQDSCCHAEHVCWRPRAQASLKPPKIGRYVLHMLYQKPRSQGRPPEQSRGWVFIKKPKRWLGKAESVGKLNKEQTIHPVWATATCKIIGTGSTAFNGFLNQLTTGELLKQMPIIL